VTRPFVAVGWAGPVHGLVGGARTDRAPAVLIHGINGSAADWAAVAERLGDERRTIALDLRGHGASTPDGPYGARDYLDDVLAVLDDRDIDRAHLIGASFGGSVAVACAALAPQRTASITALGGALRVEDPPDVDAGVSAMRQAGATTVFAGLLAEISFAPGTDPQLVRAVAERAGAREVDVIAAVTRAAFGDDVTELAASATAPALVLVGEHDLTTPVALGEQLAAALGTRARVLPGRGHMAMLEDPEAVAALIAAHLAAHDGVEVGP
jgi:pimeloyl-ACP methyl ester carboxylesterase